MTLKQGEPKHHTAHGEAQRRSLVDAAYELIAEEGFEGLRTRKVAARAGLNVATLHYYFTTKEDLVRGVARRLHKELSEMHSPSPEPRDGLQQLRQEFADELYLSHNHPSTYIVMLELYLRSLRDPAIRLIIQEMLAHWEGHIREFLTAGVKQQLFRQDLDIAKAATALRCFLQGTVTELMLNSHASAAEHAFQEIETWATGKLPATLPED
jgi:AcrR family transcriptional regulator